MVIDASFATHADMKSHIGATMSLGKGSPYSMLKKQQINTKSSTEAEVVGVDDAMPLVIWTRNFLMAQGFNVTDNVVYQDNQSAMLLERNGQASSRRHTRHINIWYFFVADRIKNGELRVEYCPTGDMLGDFFTKPLQGSQFRKLHNFIMGISDDTRVAKPQASQECVGSKGSRSYADVVRARPRRQSCHA